MAKKRMLSWLIAASLTLSLLPTAALAEGLQEPLQKPDAPVEQPINGETKTDLDDLKKDGKADSNVKEAVEKADEAAEKGPAAIENANNKITEIEETTETKIEEIQNKAENDETLVGSKNEYTQAENESTEAVEKANELQDKVTEAQEQVDEENPTVEQYKAVADAALEAANARTEAAEAIQAQVDKAQAVADAAQAAYEAAQKEYAALLESVNGQLDAVGDKETLLADAKVKLADAEKALEGANRTLDTLKTNLNDAWGAVNEAHTALVNAIDAYAGAKLTVETLEAAIKTITDEYGSKLDDITRKELEDKIKAVTDANTLKDSADTNAASAGTVKDTLDTLTGIQNTVKGINTDKKNITGIANDIAAAETNVNNVARPAAKEAFEKQWNVQDGNSWLSGRVYAKKVQLGTEYKKEITGDDIAKWFKEDPQLDDPNYVARHEWMANEGKQFVDSFLNELTSEDVKGPANAAPARPKLKEYLNELGRVLKEMQAAEKKVKDETKRLDEYNTKYKTNYQTAAELQDELDRLISAEYKKVDAADKTAFNGKVEAAENELTRLIGVYNSLVPADLGLFVGATAAQLKTALDKLSESALKQLNGALTDLNNSVDNGSKYTKDTEDLAGKMTELLSKWDAVDTDKQGITAADVQTKLNAMNTANTTLGEKEQSYSEAHEAAQKASSDYQAALQRVNEVRKALNELPDPKDPEDFNALTQEKLDALEQQLKDAQKQLTDAKQELEDAKKAEDEAKEAYEDAQKDYQDAYDEARRVVDEITGDTDDGDDDTAAAIEDAIVPLAGLIDRQTLVSSLYTHEGSPDGVDAEGTYTLALAWAVAKDVVDEEDDPEEVVTVAILRDVMSRYVKLLNRTFTVEIPGEDDDIVMNCDEILTAFFAG